MNIETKTKDNEVVGYRLSLSVEDTETWAVRSCWPCSQLAGHEAEIVVDENGLCDFLLDGKEADVENAELAACVAFFLLDACRHLWPTWGEKSGTLDAENRS